MMLNLKTLTSKLQWVVLWQLIVVRNLKNKNYTILSLILLNNICLSFFLNFSISYLLLHSPHQIETKYFTNRKAKTPSYYPNRNLKPFVKGYISPSTTLLCAYPRKFSDFDCHISHLPHRWNLSLLDLHASFGLNSLKKNMWWY